MNSIATIAKEALVKALRSCVQAAEDYERAIESTQPRKDSSMHDGKVWVPGQIVEVWNKADFKELAYCCARLGNFTIYKNLINHPQGGSQYDHWEPIETRKKLGLWVWKNTVNDFYFISDSRPEKLQKAGSSIPQYIVLKLAPELKDHDGPVEV